MKILAFNGYYLPGFKGGGPIKTVKNLFDETGDDLSYRLITSNYDLGSTESYKNVKDGEWNSVGNAEVFYIQSGILGIKQIYSMLKNEYYDLIYINSFFSPKFSIFPVILSKLFRKQLILGPRGEFSEGALKIKATKKLIFITVYRLLQLHKNIVFQASSEYEAEDIRRVLGNKVDIFIAEDIGAQEYTKELTRKSPISLKAVFISRISPKKNLLGALEILKLATKPICYDIYGPIEDFEYWVRCQHMIKKLPPHIQVQHKGELNPEQVVSTLSNYDLFFMPTKGENYGHVIAEALCAGLPILVADTTPWRDLKEKGIGWDLSLDRPDMFSNVLDELYSLPDEEHLKMREAVLIWAKDKFTQRDAIDANLNMFRYAYKKGIINNV